MAGRKGKERGYVGKLSQVQENLLVYVRDALRIEECGHCEYFDRCLEEVKEPEDNSDGSCKTKEKYIGGSLN